MQKILISNCLLGYRVRYDGNANKQDHAGLNQWISSGKVITLCPEMAGGLPTPREPAEIEYGKTADEVLGGTAKILTLSGKDVTTEYLSGAEKMLRLAQKNNIRVAILKARSPSCGSQQIYDGTFSGQTLDGIGVTACLLRQNGIAVFDETQIDEALEAAGSA